MDFQTELESKFKEVEANIAELEKVHSEAYRTNGNFRYNPTNNYSSVDITSTMNESELLHAFAFVKNKNEQYHAAASEIGISEYPVFKWCGFSPEDWQHDIKLRFKLMKYNGQLQKLKDMRAKMLPYMPQENKIKQLLLELGKM